MKKCILSFLLIMSMIGLSNKIYAISEKFLFVIETVGIPRYNAYGDEISEAVYNTYNIFSYSEPQKVVHGEQRWKNSKYGYWAKNIGPYKGSGTRGEYYILGYSYSGAIIYNHYFPMDVIPITTPDKWTFYSYPGAEKSWEDKTKYKYEEQIEHMLNSKLMFSDISSRDKADNPEYIKEYNITAGQIGKKLARIDAAATWKTNGVISTRRKISGIIYSQVYLVKPMAADAKAVCNIDVEKELILTKEQDELVIPISYGIAVENMTGYADEKHIKEIKSTLYINGKKVDEISGSKITSKGNEYMLVITREEFPPRNEHKIELKVDGYVHTEFAVDGLMQDTKTQIINVIVEKKQIIPVKETNVMLLEKNINDWVVSPLAQNFQTISKGTIGFVEAGRYLAIKLDLDVDSVENTLIYLDNILLKSEKLIENVERLVLKVNIPIETESTLFGYMSLREDKENYFLADFSRLGERNKEPHILKIVTIYDNEQHNNEIMIDTLDNYLSNINTSILVNNYNETKVKRDFKEWANE